VRIVRAAVAGLALLAGARAFAADATLVSNGFTRTLSAGERAAIGAGQLSPAQLARLDGLVDRDIRLARDGEVGGFASTFTQRLTARERSAVGVDRLTAAQVARLDALVARAIATPPPPEAEFAWQPRPAAPASAAVVPTKPPGLEVHGDVSLTVGGGSGGSFYGTALDLLLTDPNGKYTIALGFSTWHGSGRGRGRGLGYPWLEPGPWLAPVGAYAPNPLLAPIPGSAPSPLLVPNHTGN
jgi:hypothetical protein